MKSDEEESSNWSLRIGTSCILIRSCLRISYVVIYTSYSVAFTSTAIRVKRHETFFEFAASLLAPRPPRVVLDIALRTPGVTRKQLQRSYAHTFPVPKEP